MPSGWKNAGTVMPQLINNGVDLMPSICEWAGIKPPTGACGVSFCKVAESGNTQMEHQAYVVTETLFAQTGGTCGWMVRTPQYKYVLYEAGKNREMLYDMYCDRGEMRNLAVEAKYKEQLKQHRLLLLEWMKKHPTPGPYSITRFVPR